MSRIKGKDTRPEILVRKFLFSKGYRYRLHVSKLPGKPDIVLPKYKTVINIHGCFWHGHEGFRYFIFPKSNTDYWSNKINNNKQRDKKVEAQLLEQGWRVITLWECELKPKVRDKGFNDLLTKLEST